MHPPVVDAPPCEGVNPLNLNWADVPAHHSVSSVLFPPPDLLLLKLKASASVVASLFLRPSDCFPDEARKTVKSYTRKIQFKYATLYAYLDLPLR